MATVTPMTTSAAEAQHNVPMNINNTHTLISYVSGHVEVESSTTTFCFAHMASANEHPSAIALNKIPMLAAITSHRSSRSKDGSISRGRSETECFNHAH